MKKFLFYILTFLMASSCKRIEVDVKVNADFTYEVQDNNYTIPVRIVFINKSIGAQFYKWTFEGGTPATYDKRDPGVVTFNTAGNIKVKLEVWSDLGKAEKETTILLDSIPKASFDITPVINNYGPTDFKITNKSDGGAVKFNWLFTGATPSSSNLRNPADIRITVPGDYRVFLEATNDRGRKDTISKMIKVLPGLTAGFDIVPSFDDEDYEAPLLATLQNKSLSATNHNWLSPGGTLSNVTDSLPTVRFSVAGIYTITYKAGNGKDSTTVSKTITVKPNSGLRTFSNIKLGINTAQAPVANYFSTMLRTVILREDVTQANGSKIDIAFYGLSESFSYNLFVSPADVQLWTFAAIPGASNTRIINSQELCGCGANFSATNFDNVTNGNAFNSVPVTVTAGGIREFNGSMVNRVVLFENGSGKKGAIKIKQFVNAGLNSYIVCDIKVQKD